MKLSKDAYFISGNIWLAMFLLVLWEHEVEQAIVHISMMVLAALNFVKVVDK